MWGQQAGAAAAAAAPMIRGECETFAAEWPVGAVEA